MSAKWDTYCWVKLRKPQKLLDLLCALGGGPFSGGFGEPIRCFDSILGDRVTQKFSLVLHEGALAQFRVQTILAEEGQDASEMLQVLSLGLGVD